MTRSEVHQRAADLLDLHRPHDAAAMLREHLAAEPDDAVALVLQAQALNEVGDAAAAEVAARSALRLDPELHQGHLVLVDLLVAREDGDGALAVAGSTVQLHPDLWTSHYAVARALLVGRRPRVREALDAALRTVAMAPHAAPAHNLVGLCFDMLNQPDQARRAFTEALRLDPEHSTAAANLAALDAEGGHLRQSARRLTAALGRHPQESSLHGVLDALLVLLGRRLLLVVLAGAAALAIAVSYDAPYAVRALIGVGLVTLVAVLVRSFARDLPRGTARWSGGAFRRIGWWPRTLVLLLLLACGALLVMAFAPASVAAGAGLGLLGVLRVVMVVLVLGTLVGALVTLVRGR